jgi:choline dehydrogenase-like flavoprotein
MTGHSYDVVIVGGGAAGCVVAGYLAEKTNASILLVEAGAYDRDPLIHIPAGYAKILAHDHHVWPYETVPQHGIVKPYRAGRVLGGGSSINAMAYVRGQPRDYTGWQAAAGDAARWDYETMLAHFVAQEDSGILHDRYHGIGGGLSVTMPQGINELNARCLRAFQEYGLPYNPDYNGAEQRGTSPVQSTLGHARRCSAVDAHLRRHLDSGRVTLLTDRTVTRLVIEEGAATGVELAHGRGLERIAAGHVVLSAGSIHSPQLLKHSGIGPADELRRFGITVRHDAPEVGENLQDHPIVPVRAHVKGDLGYQGSAHGLGTLVAGLRYLTTRDGPAAGSGVETVSYWDPTDLAAEPTIQCYHVPIISEDGLTPTGSRAGVTFELVVIQPRSRGSIRLADSDPASMPLIDPNFVGHPDDLAAAVASVRALREVMAQPSLAEVLEDEVEPGPGTTSDEAIGDWVRRVATTMWHPVGTCRMGADAGAVVDPRLRVNGVRNLNIIDASIMPNITSGNTNAPTQALARRGAEMLAEDLA